MESIEEFQGRMSEAGYEFTYDQCRKILASKNTIKKLIQSDVEATKQMVQYTPQERLDLRQRLAENGHEITPQQIDELLTILDLFIETI